MEEIQQELQPLEQTCSKCETVIPEGQKFCSSCGYPENGTASEKAKFNADQVISNSKSKDAPKQIKSARTTLFVISGLALLSGIIFFFMTDDSSTLIAGGILAIIYLGLGFWSQEKPLIALVLGLLVYLTNIVINAVIEPESIGKGIILKVIIILFLIKGINSALHLRKSQS